MKKTSRALWNYFICLVIFINLIFFSSLPSLLPGASRTTAATPAITELRGVWLTNVSSGVMFAPWGVNRAIQRLSELNFNTVYPVVWNRGHTYYPSRVAQGVTGKSEEPFLTVTRGGSDVLAEIVKEGHKYGLSIIPWFEYGFIVPANSTIARKHPDWLTRDRQGKMLLVENKAEEDFLKETEEKNRFPQPNACIHCANRMPFDKFGSILFIQPFKNF